MYACVLPRLRLAHLLAPSGRASAAGGGGGGAQDRVDGAAHAYEGAAVALGVVMRVASGYPDGHRLRGIRARQRRRVRQIVREELTKMHKEHVDVGRRGRR